MNSLAMTLVCTTIRCINSTHLLPWLGAPPWWGDMTLISRSIAGAALVCSVVVICWRRDKDVMETCLRRCFNLKLGVFMREIQTINIPNSIDYISATVQWLRLKELKHDSRLLSCIVQALIIALTNIWSNFRNKKHTNSITNRRQM